MNRTAAVRSVGEVLRTWWDRWRPSVTGLIVAALAAWVSLMPSLLPRAWHYQGIVTGVSMLVGYGVGVALRTLWRRVVAPRISLHPDLTALGDRLLAFARLSAPYVLVVYLITATATAIRWQGFPTSSSRRAHRGRTTCASRGSRWVSSSRC